MAARGRGERWPCALSAGCASELCQRADAAGERPVGGADNQVQTAPAVEWTLRPGVAGSAWALLAAEAIRQTLHQSGWMQRHRPGSMRRESTAEMAGNSEREVRELRNALAVCRGDRDGEPRVTAALLAHLLVSSRELLQNLLIDSARRPGRIGR